MKTILSKGRALRHSLCSCTDTGPVSHPSSVPAAPTGSAPPNLGQPTLVVDQETHAYTSECGKETPTEERIMDDDVTPPAADTPDSTPTQKIDAVMAALAQAQTMLVQHGDALDVAHMNDGITSMLYDLQIMQAEQSNALVSTDSQEPDLMSVSSADSGSTAEDLDSDDPDEVFTLTADGQSHSVAAADTPSLRLAAAPLPVTGTIQFAPQRTPVSGTLAVCFIALQWKDGYGEKLQTISNLSRQAAQVYAHLSNNLIKFNKCR